MDERLRAELAEWLRSARGDLAGQLPATAAEMVGYGRFEATCGVVLGVSLLAVGTGLFWLAGRWGAARPGDPDAPAKKDAALVVGAIGSFVTLVGLAVAPLAGMDAVKAWCYPRAYLAGKVLGR